MKQNFEKILQLVLVHEGGYANNKNDPGGATMKGITHRTYDAWRTSRGMPTRDVREITDREIAAIYRSQYWDVIKGDALPSGVDYAVFDFAVNSGPGRAAKFVQRILGVKVDGHLGELTLAAIKQADARQLIVALCDARLAWVKTLKTWKHFGRGWASRIASVKDNAIRMVSDRVPVASDVPADASAHAGGPEKITTTILDTVTDPKAWTAAAPLLAAAGALVQGGGPVQWAIAGVVVLAGLTGVVWLVRAMRGAT